MQVLCVVYVFVCHACVRVGSGPPYSVWQGGPSVCVCACVREHVCVSGWWRWNELERKETGDGGGGEGGRAMTLQQGRTARSSASYLFPLRGRNSPPPPIPEWLLAQVGPGAKSIPRYGPLVHVLCAIARERLYS